VIWQSSKKGAIGLAKELQRTLYNPAKGSRCAKKMRAGGQFGPD